MKWLSEDIPGLLGSNRLCSFRALKKTVGVLSI